MKHFPQCIYQKQFTNYLDKSEDYLVLIALLQATSSLVEITSVRRQKGYCQKLSKRRNSIAGN